MEIMKYDQQKENSDKMGVFKCYSCGHENSYQRFYFNRDMVSIAYALLPEPGILDIAETCVSCGKINKVKCYFGTKQEIESYFKRRANKSYLFYPEGG